MPRNLKKSPFSHQIHIRIYQKIHTFVQQKRTNGKLDSATGRRERNTRSDNERV